MKRSYNGTSRSVVHENEHLESKLDYDPKYFLRCHSKISTDPADIRTQVWQCSFEPDTFDPTKTTDIVATCGGDSVCFIDVKSGKVVKKYYSDSKAESFFALAWTTCENYHRNNNLVVVGGALRTIHFINPAKNAVFLKHKLTNLQLRKDHITSLLFHKKEFNILFCSVSLGQIFIFDIGNPFQAKYKNEISLIHTLKSTANELFTTALSSNLNMLLVATDDFLRGWQLPDECKETISGTELVFSFPSSRIGCGNNTKLVDSVETLGGDLIATKCVLHGLIYVWNLASTLKTRKKNATTFTVVPVQTLQWSHTNNFYMSMGYDAGSGLLACGDDKGALWVYRLPGPKEAKKQPDTVLDWPGVIDIEVDCVQKLQLDTYDIVVDKVAVGNGGRYLVAVTASNVVCIWHRVE